jgi:signal transduction histidine kinase
VDTNTSVVFDEIDAKSFFHSVVEKYKSENDSKIEIEMVPDLRESMKFSGSSTLLRLALINLLANGARYAHSRVLVNLREEGGNIVIIVENDGPPIPEAQRNAIFEPFFRLDTSRSRETGGTGLGLAIVKKVVDMHRGQVSVVQSDLGGARFELILPCS